MTGEMIDNIMISMSLNISMLGYEKMGMADEWTNEWMNERMNEWMNE